MSSYYALLVRHTVFDIWLSPFIVDDLDAVLDKAESYKGDEFEVYVSVLLL